MYTSMLKSLHRIEPWDSCLHPESFIQTPTTLASAAIDTIRQTVEKFGLCVVRSPTAARYTTPPAEGEDPTEAGLVDPVMNAVMVALGQPRLNQSDAYGNQTKLIASSPSADRAAAGTLKDLPPHTDGTFLAGAPPSFVLLQYLAEPDLGGDLTFVDMASVLARLCLEAPDRARDMIESLQDPQAFEFRKKLPNGDEVRGSTTCVFTSPSLQTVSAFGLRMRLDDGFIATPTASEAYELFKRLAADHDQQLRFIPERYDLVIVDNWRVMHGRDQYFTFLSRSHRRAWVDAGTPYLPSRLFGVRPLEVFRSSRSARLCFPAVVDSAIHMDSLGNSSGATLQTALRQLYGEQLARVSRLGFRARPQFPKNLQDLAAYAREGMQAAVSGFGRLENVTGSWISSMSLPTQLIIQPHLTVDLTVTEACKEKPFGLPFESLLELAVEGHVYLNIRDYDSQDRLNFSGYLSDYGEHNLSELLKRAYSRIYIGGALRKSVFDSSIALSGRSFQYESLYEDAQVALDNAYQIFAALGNEDPIVQRSMFRGERPSLVAVCWHWAFLNSVAHFLDPSVLSANDDKTLLVHEGHKSGDPAQPFFFGT